MARSYKTGWYMYSQNHQFLNRTGG
jgi:hypothetical protein